jgi:hypothetical protein
MKTCTILSAVAILSTLLRRVGHAASNNVTDVQLSIYHGRSTLSLLMKDACPPKSSVSRHDFQASTTTGVSRDDLGKSHYPEVTEYQSANESLVIRDAYAQRELDGVAR